MRAKKRLMQVLSCLDTVTCNCSIRTLGWACLDTLNNCDNRCCLKSTLKLNPRQTSQFLPWQDTVTAIACIEPIVWSNFAHFFHKLTTYQFINCILWIQLGTITKQSCDINNSNKIMLISVSLATTTNNTTWNCLHATRNWQ